MGTPYSTRPPGEPGGGYAPGQEADQAGFGPGFAGSAWPAFLAAGLGALAVGVILLVWPKATLTIVAVLIGIALIVAGMLRLIDGFTAHDATGGKRVAYVLIGLLAIVVGLYCIRHYNLVIGVLAIIVGLFWVIHGIADIAIGLFGGPFPGRGLTVLAGVLSLCAGLIVLFWPSITVIVLVRVIGIWLIVYGLVAAVMALSLRRGASKAPDADRVVSA
jgi:uncharacterized membrane protein HdeD (DUF308 family)